MSFECIACRVSPANTCWPAFSLRDWRLLSPGVLGEGSLCRLGGVVGFGWGTVPPSLGSRSAKDGRCETLHHLLWMAEVTGVELFPPVASQIMPMVKGKVR